jgi:hypothetical protein
MIEQPRQLTFTTRFEISPELVDIIKDLQSRNYNLELAPMCGKHFGRLCVEVHSHYWPNLSISDSDQGIHWMIYDMNWDSCTDLFPWTNLGYALELFDRVVLWHGDDSKDEPYPFLTWHEIGSGEII